MRKQKILALGTALLLTLSLAGCGGETTIGQDIYDGLNNIPVEDIVDGASSMLDNAIQGAADAWNEGAETSPSSTDSVQTATSFSLDDIPEFSDSPYVTVNDNIPYFTENDLTTEAFETYSELDDLGRCGVAYANVCQELMPTEERGEIGQVKPTGWHTVKYDFVSGKYLYNRCHLLGYQLTGENANEQNLITGTRYLNVEGMLPFENMVADYVEETDNHVLYRVTPIFEGDELVARGVLMEGLSVEDDGEGICFNVYCYNNQPGVIIDYATGESQAA